MFIAIAIHHAAPEHAEEFGDFMHRVVAATTGAPGLIDFRPFSAADGSFLAGVSLWESEDDFKAGLERIGSLHHERKPEWTIAPDEVLMLNEMSAARR